MNDIPPENIISAQEQIINSLRRRIDKLNSEKDRVKATNERWRKRFAKVKAQRDKLAIQITLGEEADANP